jgi:TetR/AcrR family transcriptional regulator, transcriptional repressor for nem operon
MQSDTAERILDAANALLIDRGYAAFSYADIAEAVKIRKASIHHHFPTKAGLVVAVLQRHRARTAAGMESLDQQFTSPTARLKHYFKYWEGCIETNTVSFCIAALLGAELPSLPEDVQREVRLHFSLLTEWFEKTLKAASRTHELRLPGSIATEAQILIAVMHGAMLSARAAKDSKLFRSVTHASFQRLALSHA